jgi:RNA polymerase sigma-70 factor (ECF subfamily)
MQPARPDPAVAAPDEDSAFMERLCAGDDTALAPLMERWELPVKAVIARIVLNATEAEELAQETFVRVWQQRGKFRPGAAFRPWLFAIAVNLARNRLRWWRRRPTVSLDEWMDGGERRAGFSPPSGAGNGGLKSGLPPEGAAALEQVERAGAVRDAIAALPVDLREAIVLFEYENLSHAEIAAVVGATPKAVETRIYRAKAQLRSALASLR